MWRSILAEINGRVIVLLFGWEYFDAKPWPNNEKRYLKVSSMIECMKLLSSSRACLDFETLQLHSLPRFCVISARSQIQLLLVVVYKIGQVRPIHELVNDWNYHIKKAQTSIKYCHDFSEEKLHQNEEILLLSSFWRLSSFQVWKLTRLTIRGTWFVILRFLPVSYSFHYKNLWESICLWSSTITHGFWLDKVSKYHIDSLAKMIVQRATSSPLGPSIDGTFDTFFKFLFLQVFQQTKQGRGEILWLKCSQPMRETHWKTETAYKYYFYREIEIF